MHLDYLQKNIHANAIQHGWWDNCYSNESVSEKIPEKILLVHCELSEAIEEFRNGRIETWYNDLKPEGVFVELADAIIRILDLAGACGVDMQKLILEKHDYNLSRPYRHGGKAI